jgi:phage-related minor tail protein
VPLGQARVANDNQGPLAAYLDSIPKSANEINEALEGIQANGLSSLIDGLSETKGSFKDLASVVSNTANQIIASLVKIGLQRAVLSLFGSLVGGGGVGKYASPFASSGSSFVPDSSGLPSLAGARANGGSVIGGKNYLVGEMGPEVFTAPHSGNIIANKDLSGSQSGGGIMEVRLRDELLDARIISGSSRVTQAGIAQNQQQQSKFASRRLGR